MAKLILLNGNRLEDVRNTQLFNAVILRKYLSRASRKTMLNAVEIMAGKR
jgi:hypothetical protein